jgi:hypothetical protein
VTESPLVKRLLWSGLLTVLGGAATFLTTKVAERIWQRLFDEDPPE